MNCPSCSHKISWKKISLFTNFYTKRLKGDCPACGTKLIFIKWPIRLFNIASLLLTAGLASLNIEAIEVFEQEAQISTWLLTFSGIFYLLVAKSKKLKVAKI
jgi:endogenous inhibitor of DNA gyrase (YacG/DUF329 family)